MSNPGPISSNRELLSDLKEDTAERMRAHEPGASHVAGATGKLASAIAQHHDIGAGNLASGTRTVLGSVPVGRGPLDRDAVLESLDMRATKKIDEQTGGEGFGQERGSEGARLQSAAEQYAMGMEGEGRK
ncbi:hypothetical protein EJ06DRAFT_521368 [Trichodelitschia bisporula]|uniref:SMP domain-containing protein n=1 Tax=Trichodelitschia bisporula TaxID=703511 RepID=A0A6G1HX84_9PEZI|nr:hypothetical protein EJ06DRAFT_521368 [Trichodelitschia bisporula]